MVRNLRLALPTAAAVFALMTVPPLLPAPMTAGLSGSALAAVKLNTSRSNIYRLKGKPKQSTGAARAVTVKSAKSNSSDRLARGNSGLAGPSGLAGTPRAAPLASGKLQR
jgi:hypothetical protein